uniref:Uncharacterized protein n=1 Tax=Anopheles coluzzii TaxID=1518534 RepID=A0A8W7P796_ANOCL
MVNSGGYVDVASYVNKFLAEGNPYTTGMIEDDGRRFVGREREHGKVPLPATGTSLSSIPEVVNYTPLQTELPRESKFRMKKSKACINNKEQHNRTAVEMDQSTLNETTVHNQTASARRSQLG